MKCKKCGKLIAEAVKGLCEKCYKEYKLFILKKHAEELGLKSSDIKQIAKMMIKEEYEEYLKEKEGRKKNE